MTEERLPELPVADEIHVLLEMEQVGTDPFECSSDVRREGRREHLADDRLGEVLETGGICARATLGGTSGTVVSTTSLPATCGLISSRMAE